MDMTVKLFINLMIVKDISVALMRGCLVTVQTTLCTISNISGQISLLNVNVDIEMIDN